MPGSISIFNDDYYYIIKAIFGVAFPMALKFSAIFAMNDYKEVK